MSRVFTLRTSARSEFIEITGEVAKAVAACRRGIGVVFVPHTTAGVFINENADPDVGRDLATYLDDLVPRLRPGLRHAEGNSDAHMKAVLVGSSVSFPIADGRPLLGTWQGIFFAEFDGPRERRYRLSIIPEAGEEAGTAEH